MRDVFMDNKGNVVPWRRAEREHDIRVGGGFAARSKKTHFFFVLFGEYFFTTVY
jgi:hypothetical protein